MTTNIPALSSGPYKQNNLTELVELDTFRYENLFNVYQNENQQYFYNLLAKVNFPEEISDEYYTTFTVNNDSIPYTLISYKVYNTISLWWLICAVNNITNPIDFPAPNTQLKILKTQYVRNVLQSIKQ